MSLSPNITREELRKYLIDYTYESPELIDESVMKKLDDIREFIHYLREGESDITMKSFDETVDKIVSYILS